MDSYPLLLLYYSSNGECGGEDSFKWKMENVKNVTGRLGLRFYKSGYMARIAFVAKFGYAGRVEKLYVTCCHPSSLQLPLFWVLYFSSFDGPVW